MIQLHIKTILFNTWKSRSFQIQAWMSQTLVCFCNIIIILMCLSLSTFTHRNVHWRFLGNYIWITSTKALRCLHIHFKFRSRTRHFIKSFNLLSLIETNTSKAIGHKVTRTRSTIYNILCLPGWRICPCSCLLRWWFTSSKLCIYYFSVIIKGFTFKLQCLYSLGWSTLVS